MRVHRAPSLRPKPSRMPRTVPFVFVSVSVTQNSSIKIKEIFASTNRAQRLGPLGAKDRPGTGERLCRRVARKAGLGFPQNPLGPLDVLLSELEFSAQNSNLEVVRFARRFN